MKRIKRFLVSFLIMIFTVGSLTGSNVNAAAVSSGDRAKSINFVGNIDDIKGNPGEKTHVKLPVRAYGGYIIDPNITVSTENAALTISNITYTADGYTKENPLTMITNYSTTYIEFDVSVKETAGITKSKLNVKIEFYAQDTSDGSVDSYTLELPAVYFVIESEKEPAQLTVDNISFKNAIIGEETILSFTVKNEGEISSRNTYISIGGYKEAGIVPNYSKLNISVGNKGKLEPGKSDNLSLPVVISSSAKAGNTTLTINMKYKDADGKEYTDSSTIYITIEENKDAPQIVVESTKYASELEAGDEFSLVATLGNKGTTTANDVQVTVDGLGTTSFLPNYNSKTIDAGNIKSNAKKDVKIPLIVSEEATVGLKEVPLTITYKDASGVEKTTTTKLYLEVVSKDGVDASGKSNVVISNVSQSSNQPNAGDRVDVSFDIENKSMENISDVKIFPSNLTSANFSPVNSNPYQYFDEIKGGKKKRITIPLTISKTIPEGTSTLEITYEYKDEKGKTWSDNKATIYVLNIKNEGTAKSKPKLIISKYKTDQDKLVAGKTFKLTFDIKNTHVSTSAKNIKVTVTQADNIFAVTSGSNSFYITQIPAGETMENTLEFKVKSDAVTKTYPIEVTMEYEYDGAEANPTTGQIGETAKEIINLQAIENTRPMVNNVMVGNGEPLTVNVPASLTFDFFNMGKSPLNNVSAKVEGDFTLTTGDMTYIGNVEAGSSEYGELEVMPTIEGTAKGKLIITFEDSNGDEVKLEKEIEATVQAESIPVMEDPGANMGNVTLDVKKNILPIWAFVLIQIAIVIVFIPLSRKLILGLYRRKLRKQEEAE